MKLWKGRSGSGVNTDLGRNIGRAFRKCWSRELEEISLNIYIQLGSRIKDILKNSVINT